MIEQIASFQDTKVTNPNVFAFFKGLNDAAQGGVLSADVTNGLPVGFYRLASINTAANHQPVLVAIAQHGSVDDMVYVRTLSFITLIMISVADECCVLRDCSSKSLRTVTPTTTMRTRVQVQVRRALLLRVPLRHPRLLGLALDVTGTEKAEDDDGSTKFDHHQ